MCDVVRKGGEGGRAGFQPINRAGHGASVGDGRAGAVVWGAHALPDIEVSSGAGGSYSLVACLSRLTLDPAFLSRWREHR